MIETVVSGWHMMANVAVLFVPFAFVSVWIVYHWIVRQPFPKRTAPIVAIWAAGSIIGVPALLVFLLMLGIGIGHGSSGNATAEVLFFSLVALGATWHFGIVVLLPYLSWRSKRILTAGGRD